jgi:Cys-tRNA(Pro) deacylase
MVKPQYPVSTAIRALRSAHVSYVPHLYTYEERGGTKVSARELGVDEHEVVKTLILEDDQKRPMIALMHGDCEVSTRSLARHLGVKGVSPCSPAVADRHSGYQVGGTSPFGTKRPMPVYAQVTLVDLPRMFINGGKRGFLVEVAPQPALDLLKAELLEMRA